MSSYSMFKSRTFEKIEPKAFTITLSALCNQDDHRELRLAAGETLILGRSSKSGTKGLSATTSNAYFDCPVVSRQHASLTIQDGVVTIIDSSSLHGTAVNGLRLAKDKTHALAPGDIIKLGDRVTRGDDAHDGISLKFDIVSCAPQEQASNDAADRARGFYAPSSPDSEENDSDYDPEVDDVHAVSSDKSDPDQAPSSIGTSISSLGGDKPGWQSMVIDLTNVGDVPETSGRKGHITDLDDDDDDIQFVAETLRLKHEKARIMAEAASIDVRREALSQILYMSDNESEIDDDIPDASNSEDDQVHEDDVDSSEYMSESDEPDESESNEEERHVPDTAGNKEHSDRWAGILNIPDHNGRTVGCYGKPATETISRPPQMPSGTPEESLPVYSFASKLHYDPVRGSAPPNKDAPANTEVKSAAYSDWPPLSNPWAATDSGYVLPTPPTINSAMASTTRSLYYPCGYGSCYPFPYGTAATPVPESMAPAQELPRGNRPIDSNYQFTCMTHEVAETQSMLPQADEVNNVQNEQEEVVDVATQSNSKKRKADVDEEAEVQSERPSKIVKLPAFEAARINRGQIRARNKLAKTAGVYKLAASTGLLGFAGGAAAMVAFLSSAHSQRLIEWLG